MASERSAVRWARREVAGVEEWTKWHLTSDGERTHCGRILPAFPPHMEWDHHPTPGRATCRKCHAAPTPTEAPDG